MKYIAGALLFFAFTIITLAGGGANSIPGASGRVSSIAEDTLIFKQVIEEFLSPAFVAKPAGEQVIAVATFFVGRPYAANTLDMDTTERLVVNLREFDCVTLVETILALTSTLNLKSPSIGHFYRELAATRYRHGVVDGYLSRLHYFTEWLQHNTIRGRIKLVNCSPGLRTIDWPINFMSDNSHLYRQLEQNPHLINELDAIEERVSTYRLAFIPKERVGYSSKYIREGDILAFVTSIPGLDVSHAGFATWVGNELRLLHASTRERKVEVTNVSLKRYIEQNHRVAGIVVGRVLNRPVEVEREDNEIL